MDHTQLKPILLFLIAALLGALGQYLYKTGAESSANSFVSWVTNYRIILGIFCYTAVMFLFVYAFKIGGSLTVLYPVYATTFIWALLIGVVFLKEPVTAGKIGGAVLIILGVFLSTL